MDSRTGKYVPVLAIIILLAGSGGSQTQFVRTIGGAADDKAFSIVKAVDGGFVLAGETSSFGTGERAALLVRFDSSWNLEWTRILDLDPDMSMAYSLVQAEDGGYALAGNMFNFGSVYCDVLLSKFDC